VKGKGVSKGEFIFELIDVRKFLSLSLPGAVANNFHEVYSMRSLDLSSSVKKYSRGLEIF
jgi:hypothetical protein